MSLTQNQARCLTAVRDGEVKHCHPLTFVVPLALLDIPKHQRLLLGLERRKLIQVDATSAEFQRPVHITPAGEEALRAYAADPPKTGIATMKTVAAFLARKPARNATTWTDGDALWWKGEGVKFAVCLLAWSPEFIVLHNHRDDDHGLPGRAVRGIVRRGIRLVPHIELDVDPVAATKENLLAANRARWASKK